MNRFAGMDVIENPLLVTTTYPKMNWRDKVRAWNPCNERRLPIISPSEEVLIMGNKIIAHPLTLNRIRMETSFFTIDTRTYA